MRDRHALDGKIPAPAERFDLVVVGAGPAGTAAATAAAVAGRRVLLIDENPVPGALIGTDVPLFFGGRATAAVQQQGRMVEQLFAANPALESAFEAGVDVRLGTVAWGLYRNGPGMRTLPEPLLGIADGDKAEMIGFDHLLLATGARDVVLGFPGWNQPGVMGVQGFHLLLTRYATFAGRRILILGSGLLAVEAARLALANGLEVAGLVEVGGEAQCPEAAVFALFAGYTVKAVAGGVDGVERVTLAALASGDEVELLCDTVVQAVAVMPALELLHAADCSAGGTISLAGDCATVEPPAETHLMRWATALARHAGPDIVVCQCEEVSRGDLLGVQPPGYLERPPRMAGRDLDSLIADGPANPDQLKRLTRAGMGACQGRRCREQVACLLAAHQGVPLSAVPFASFRAPVRPVPLAVLADWDEGADMTLGWDVWFGIPTQWTPYDAIGTPEEAKLVSGLGGANMHV
jgi:thioredoxin reductase